MRDGSVQDILFRHPNVQLQRCTVPLNVCSLTSQHHIYASVIETTVNTSSQDFIDAGLSLDILESLRLVPRPLSTVPVFATYLISQLSCLLSHIYLSFVLAFCSWLTFSY